jgi:DNA-binding beta-propeller fold protein YncE
MMIPAKSNPQANDEDLDEMKKDERRRKWLLLLLLLLLLCICCVGLIFLRYLANPQPLPEMVPQQVAQVNYPPHYLFSIYGVNKPVGVTASATGDRIYVSETGGDRLVRIFNRDGAEQGTIAPPGTSMGQRSPVYLAMDQSQRLFVADRLQNAVFVYDAEGKYLDSILGPEITLSKYVTKHLGGNIPAGTTYFYNVFSEAVTIQQPGQEAQSLPAPQLAEWDPLGVRFDRSGNLYLTIMTDHSVRRYPAQALNADSWANFQAPDLAFGKYGQENGQLLFPNGAVVDKKGRIYVADGNNGRVSVWDGQGKYLLTFAKGNGESALSLPRGLFIDERDRLFVVDAVGQNVKVYDVAGETPAFLYAFGDFGLENGQFNYPADVFLDSTGRLYIADRENNRIQVWSY